MRAALLLFLAAAVPAQAGEDDGNKAEITPIAQLQMWGTAFDQDQADQADGAGYGDPEHDMGFSIRRARVGLEGHKGALDFQLDFGLSAPYDSVRAAGRSGPEFAFANAYARGSTLLGPGVARASFGLVRVPFARERLMSSRQLTFQERAVGIAWIGPSQDLGVLLDYELDAGVRIQAGVYNGGGNLFTDDNDGVMVAGRIEYAKGETYLTYGEAKDGVDLGIAASAYWNDDVATDRIAAEVDALVRVSRLTLMVEAATLFIQPGDSTIDLPDAFDPTQQLGLTGQVSYWIPVGEDVGSDAERSAIEAAVRVGTFDDNMALSDNGDVLIADVGGTWRNVTGGVDLGLGFIHREELGGRGIPNDTVRLWGQLRWPIRPVRTTSSSVVPKVPAPDLPPADEMMPGPR